MTKEIQLKKLNKKSKQLIKFPKYMRGTSKIVDTIYFCIFVCTRIILIQIE